MKEFEEVHTMNAKQQNILELHWKDKKKEVEKKVPLSQSMGQLSHKTGQAE